MIAPEADKPIHKPWNLSWVIRSPLKYLTIFGPGMILLAFNWKRLGKPQWVLPTFLVGAIPLMLLIVWGIGVQIYGDEQIPEWYMWLSCVALLVHMLLFMEVADLQTKAYWLWREKGSLAYPYNWRRAARNIGGFVVLLSVLTVGVVLYRLYELQPRTFESENFTVEYPRGDWQVRSPDQRELCEMMDVDCVFYLRWKDGAVIHIAFVDVATVDPLSPDVIERQTWDDSLAENPSLKLKNRDTLTVDGYIGAVREFSLPVNDDDDEYMMQIYFANGDTVLEINVWAEDEDYFEIHHDDIMKVIKSIHFTAQSSSGV